MGYKVWSAIKTFFKDMLWLVLVVEVCSRVLFFILPRCLSTDWARGMGSSSLILHNLPFMLTQRGISPFPFIFNEVMGVPSLVSGDWMDLVWIWFFLAMPTIIVWMRLRAYLAEVISRKTPLKSIQTKWIKAVIAELSAVIIVSVLVAAIGSLVAQLPHSWARASFLEEHGYLDCPRNR